MILRIFILGAAILVSGCIWKSESPSAASTTPLGDGYSLLAELLAKEKKVDMILIVKHAPEDVVGTIKRIAEFSDECLQGLQALAEGSEITLEQTHLPPIEQEAREAIEAAQAQELLSRNGREFTALLLYGQVQGLEYMKHLCDVLEKIEKNGERKKFLEETGREAWNLRNRAFAHLCELK